MNKVSSALNKSGIETNQLTGLEKKYSAEIKQTQRELKNTKLVRDADVTSLNKEYTARKKIIDQQKISTAAAKKDAVAKEKASKESVAALNREIVAAKKVQAARDKKTASDKAADAETKRVTAGVLEYERALTKLHNEYKAGELSKVKYVKGESRLRRELKLTEKQVKDTNRAIAADTNKAKTRSTDLLTTATRRLAQAYTVLLASQKASAAIGDSVKAYGDLEEAQIKVAKTSDLTKDKILEMSKEFERLSQDVTPTATNELLRYAEVAGQLGVKGAADISKMVEVADALAVSTDIAGDEAITLLSRILTMTNEGVPAIDNLASVVVGLGNETKTVESEIVQMTKEIVTGTTAIGLNAKAAAALGTTLKELGQTGERSRSAFTRLSATINDAVTDGGADLELLQKITGQTADELERNLKDRPEIIINDFISGLSRLRNEGKSTKNTLGELGITAGESVQVFDALANNVKRYAEIVAIADEANVSANNHTEEANKAYASQNAQMKRLVNTFTALKTEIGEAYSDETFDAFENVTRLINENKEATIGFMENLVDAGVGLVETVSLLSEMNDSMGELVGGVSLTGIAFNGLKAGLNTLSVTSKNTLKGFADLRIGILEAKQAAGELSEDGVKALEKLKERSERLNKSMIQDLQDITDASLDMAGESSDAYRDFTRVIGENEEAVSKLSKAQQAEIQLIIESGEFNAELNSNYRTLTASVIQLKNKLQILNKQNEIKIESDRKAAEALAKKNAEELKAVEFNKNLVIQYRANLAVVKALNEMLDKGTISVQNHSEAVNALEKEQVKLKEATTNVGIIYEDLAESIEVAEVSYEGMSTAAINFTSTIVEQKQELNDLRAVISNKLSSDEDQAQAQRDLITVGRELKQTQFELAIQTEIDTASASRLSVVKRTLVRDLEALNRTQSNGTLLTAQELKEKVLLEEAIDKLNLRINEHKDETDDDSDAIDDNIDAIKDQKEAFEDNTEAINENTKSKEELSNSEFNASISASAHVNAQLALQKQYDFTGLSIDALIEKYSTMDKGVKKLALGHAEWFGDLNSLTNAAALHERATVDQTISMKLLQERIESGVLSMQELESASRNAANGFDKLDDTQLDPLRAAIELARQEFEALDESINRSFDKTQDRLDELLGNEAEILAREFQREMEEAQALLDQARDSGDRDIINRAQQNIAILTKAQGIELQQYKDETAAAKAEAAQAKVDAAKNERDTIVSSTTSTSNDAVSSGGGSVRVELVFPSTGQVLPVDVLGQSDADNLLSALESLATNNLIGVN